MTPTTINTEAPRPDRLAEMMAMQIELQERLFGMPMYELGRREKIEAIKENALALQSEVFEALQEVGWKSWATSKHINSDAFKAELVDVFKFFMNLMIHVGMTPDELFAGFAKKNMTNHKRITDNYDGVSTKCPGCRRAYDDPAVKCTPSASPSQRPFCEYLGTFNPNASGNDLMGLTVTKLPAEKLCPDCGREWHVGSYCMPPVGEDLGEEAVPTRNYDPFPRATAALEKNVDPKYKPNKEKSGDNDKAPKMKAKPKSLKRKVAS